MGILPGGFSARGFVSIHGFEVASDCGRLIFDAGGRAFVIYPLWWWCRRICYGEFEDVYGDYNDCISRLKKVNGGMLLARIM